MEIRAETTRTLVCVVIAWMLFGSLAFGQSIFATLTGMVSDPSGAVVPSAKVHLRNESTGSMRDTVTNNDGYFTFASLAVGDFTYDLTVEAQGFVSYKASGIALGGGEKRNYRIVDFKRNKDGIPATVKAIEYDPNRSARLALLFYKDGEKRYILAPNELKVGDTVISGPEAEARVGNCLPLEHIPTGTTIHGVTEKPMTSNEAANRTIIMRLIISFSLFSF